MKNLPRYKECFVCGKNNPIGLNITFKTDGKIVFVNLKLKKEYCGFKNRVHGGILSTIIDEAMGWACSVKTKRLYYTIELNIKFKKAALPNEQLIVEAEFIKEKHSICASKGIIKNAKSDILIIASGKYYPIEESEEKSIFAMLHHEPEDNKPVTKEDL